MLYSKVCYLPYVEKLQSRFTTNIPCTKNMKINCLEELTITADAQIFPPCVYINFLFLEMIAYNN
jgi:hypothetical protein